MGVEEVKKQRKGDFRTGIALVWKANIPGYGYEAEGGGTGEK